MRKHANFTGYKLLTGLQWGNIKRHAKVKGIPWNLSIKTAYQILEQQDFRCVYTGQRLLLNKYHSYTRCKKEGNASLDRINSRLGYTKKNVQWVLNKVNYAKHQLSHDEFILMCNQITENYHGNITGN